MSYPVTVVIPDCDVTYDGKFYLPGEHVPVESSERCPLCDYPLGEHPDTTTVRDVPNGDHDGIIATPSAQGDMVEAMHLRCVMDSAEQYGSIGFITAAAEITHVGRHSAYG